VIVPEPARLTLGAGHFELDAHTAVSAGPGAEAAADLLRTLLAPATGLPLTAEPAGADPAGADPAGRITLALDPALGPEEYRLTVTPDAVELHAADPAGLLHGVQTIRQLLPVEALGDRPAPGTAWRLPAVRITDRPRHSWRGVMLDVARHFQPAAFLHRFVDLLALHKLNVLHLHLTDDQGWRMPVAAYPRLTDTGAWRAETMLGPAGSARYDGTPHGGAYTTAELRTLVAYAARRGVTVVPEIEMPGHARAALAAYPQFGNHPGRRLPVWTAWGVSEAVFGVHDEALAFCREVLAEVLDVFPSPWIHLGGDECPTTEWEQSPRAHERARAEGLAGPTALRPWFLARMSEYLLAHGRRPVCWAEGEAEESSLPPEAALMAWRDPLHGLAAARRGHPVVLTPWRSTYLDYPQDTGPSEPPGQPGATVTLEDVYRQEPGIADWDQQSAARVLGVQAQLWTEFVPRADHLEHLAFPRLCALAEAGWSGSPDWPGFQRRLVRHRARLAAAGVRRLGS